MSQRLSLEEWDFIALHAEGKAACRSQLSAVRHSLSDVLMPRVCQVPQHLSSRAACPLKSALAPLTFSSPRPSPTNSAASFEQPCFAIDLGPPRVARRIYVRWALDEPLIEQGQDTLA